MHVIFIAINSYPICQIEITRKNFLIRILTYFVFYGMYFKKSIWYISELRTNFFRQDHNNFLRLLKYLKGGKNAKMIFKTK